MDSKKPPQSNDKPVLALNIHQAAQNGDLDHLEACLQAGIPPDTMDEEADFPLHLAVYYNHPRCVQRLLEAGADPNRINGSERSPAQIGISFDFGDCLRLLFDHGGNPNAEDTLSGNNLLTDAVELGAKSCVAVLLEAGADPELMNAKGFSARELALAIPGRALANLIEAFEQRRDLADAGIDCEEAGDGPHL